MSDNKKYYYLKLKENFYDSEEMIILQNMPDGYLYSDILLKLYLRSIKNEGKLIFKDVIPYTPEVLAQVVRHQVGTVEKALKIFQQLGLIEILDNGTIYMSDIQNFIGQSSTEADRKRLYRDRIKQDKIQQNMIKEDDIKQNKTLNSGQMSTQTSDKNPPEIEIEKEIEIKKNIIKRKKTFVPPTLNDIQEYINSKKLNVVAKDFYDYFTVGNWIDSEGKPVINWKQKLLTWEKFKTNNKPNSNLPIKQTNYNNYDKREYKNLNNLYSNKK